VAVIWICLRNWGGFGWWMEAECAWVAVASSHTTDGGGSCAYSVGAARGAQLAAVSDGELGRRRGSRRRRAWVTSRRPATNCSSSVAVSDYTEFERWHGPLPVLPPPPARGFLPTGIFIPLPSGRVYRCSINGIPLLIPRIQNRGF
jgi:hypothetical protein